MTTRVRIERLVVDGFRLDRWERAALGPAIARELSQLAGGPARPPADGPAGQPAGPGRQGPAVDLIAREVAAAVHRAMAPGRSGGRR